MISLIFKKRNVSLLPCIEEITAAFNYKSPALNKKGSDEQKQQAEDLDNFLEILNTWSASALREEKAKIPGFLKIQQHLRHKQTPDANINKSVVKLKDVHYRMVYRGLKWTTFNWFTSPKGNNTQAMRSCFVKSLLEESQMHFDVRKPLLKTVPHLYELRQQVLDVIQAIPGLGKFTFWSQFSEPTETVEAINYDDKLVASNIRKVHYEHLDQQMTKAWDNLVSALCKPGILGIPVAGAKHGSEPSYQLHPDMYNVLLKAYKAS